MTVKIKHLQSKVEEDDTNPVKWLQYLGALLEEGYEEMLRSAIYQALNVLKKGALLPERFHKPLLKALKEYHLGNHIEMVSMDLETFYGDLFEEDEPLKRLIRSARKSTANTLKYPYFGPKIKGEQWWDETCTGPMTYKGGTWVQEVPAFLSMNDEGDWIMNLLGHDDDNFLIDIEAKMGDRELRDNLKGTLKVDSRFRMICYDNDETLYMFGKK